MWTGFCQLFDWHSSKVVVIIIYVTHNKVWYLMFFDVRTSIFHSRSLFQSSIYIKIMCQDNAMLVIFFSHFLYVWIYGSCFHTNMKQLLHVITSLFFPWSNAIFRMESLFHWQNNWLKSCAFKNISISVKMKNKKVKSVCVLSHSSFCS